jgi:hypothetical protein
MLMNGQFYYHRKPTDGGVGRMDDRLELISQVRLLWCARVFQRRWVHNYRSFKGTHRTTQRLYVHRLRETSSDKCEGQS